MTPIGKSATYVEIAKDAALAKRLARAAPNGTQVTPVAEWKTLGTEQPAAGSTRKGDRAASISF